MRYVSKKWRKSFDPRVLVARRRFVAFVEDTATIFMCLPLQTLAIKNKQFSGNSNRVGREEALWY